jgi:hypothetical protein
MPVKVYFDAPKYRGLMLAENLVIVGLIGIPAGIIFDG